MSLAEQIQATRDVRAKNDTGNALTLGDIVGFSMVSTDEEGLSAKIPQLNDSAMVLSGFGVVQTPSGVTVADGEYLLVRVRGKSKVRIIDSGVRSADGQCIRAQDNSLLGLPLGALPDMDPAGTPAIVSNQLAFSVVAIAMEVGNNTADEVIDGYVIGSRC